MKKTYVYLIILALLVLIVVLAFRFVNTPDYQFAKDSANALKNCDKAEYVYTPDAIAKAIINKDEHILLIDVRNKHEFVNGHLPNAIHMPKASILDDDNYKLLRDLESEGKVAVFYGDSPIEANIPFMILKQMGFDNIGFSCESYDFFKNNDLKQVASSKSLYVNNETPIIDFSKYIKEENLKVAEQINSKKEIAKKKSPNIRKKIVAKKTVITKPKSAPAQPVEEEEGC